MQMNDALNLKPYSLLGYLHARGRGGLSRSDCHISCWRIPSAASDFSCDSLPPTSRADSGIGFHSSCDRRISKARVRHRTAALLVVRSRKPTIRQAHPKFSVQLSIEVSSQLHFKFPITRTNQMELRTYFRANPVPRITNGMIRRFYLVSCLCMRGSRRRHPMELHGIDIDSW